MDLITDDEKRRLFEVLDTSSDALQSVLDVLFNELDKPENKNLKYGDILKELELKYGSTVCFIIQAAMYDNFVCNEGHFAYFESGAATDFMENDKHFHKTELHDKMRKHLDLLEREGVFSVGEMLVVKEVYSIMNTFFILKAKWEDLAIHEAVCTTCYGLGEVEEDLEGELCQTCNGVDSDWCVDCDGDGIVTRSVLISCVDCDGLGFKSECVTVFDCENKDHLLELDERYDNVSDDWVKILNGFTSRLLK